MQDILNKVLATPLVSAGVLCAAGVAGGVLGLVLPTTACFMLAGLVLMTASGRAAAE
jgi:hypothetical protein